MLTLQMTLCLQAGGNALVSANQRLNQAKSTFNIEMRQELLGWAKVSVCASRCRRITQKAGPYIHHTGQNMS